MTRRRLNKLVAAMLATAAATAPAYAALPSSSELTNSPGAVQLKAPAAWARGATGRNVIVGVIDTGVNSAHPDLAGKVLTGFNSVSNNTLTGDTNGHGTHVAGIIAAASNMSGVVGTAFDARILPVKIFDANGRGTSSALSAGLRYAAGKAQILNLSLSAPGPVSETELRNAVTRGQLIVAAAGNSARANPDWPARYASLAWANGQIIGVGAVDANNRIASFSNRAGTTKNFFLVARGTSVLSTYASGYAYMSGTSMATPYVSGAAAAVWSYWPYLSAKQVANSLFMSATDLGAPGIDDVYGRGLINIDKALQPIGLTLVRTASGRYALASYNYYVPGVSYANSLSRFARSGGFALAIEDELGRDFQTDLGATVMQPAGLTLDDVFGQMEQRMNLTDKVFADGTRLTLAPMSAAPSDNALDADRSAPVSGGFAVRMALANGDAWGVGSNGFADRFFGLGGALLDQAPMFDAAALADPLFALVPAHGHLGYAYDFGRGINLRAGVLTGGLASATDLGISGTREPGSSNLWTTELSHQTAARYLSVSVSQLREEDGLLGSEQDDLFALHAPAITTAASLQGAWRIAPNLALAGRYTVGYTPQVGAEGNSLVSDVSAVQTDAFAAGLIRADAWRSGDRLSLTLSQPLRASSGTMTFDVPVGNDAAGQMHYETRGLELRTSGRELRTELSYVTPVGRHKEVGVVLAHRQQPDHDANAPDDSMAAVRWQMQF